MNSPIQLPVFQLFLLSILLLYFNQCFFNLLLIHLLLSPFPKILQNLSNCPALDIRDLTIHELSLAGSQNWVIRRTALSKSKKKPANGTVPAPIDWNDVQLTVDDIVARNWFDDAKDNPPLVAYIMDKINERVVGKTLY